MPDWVGLDVKGIPELKSIFARVPRELQGQITEDVSTYMVDVLRINPPEKRIKRSEAYPIMITVDYGPHKGKIVQGYFSSAQYYFVNWLARTGKIPYKRTQEQSRGWKKIGSGAEVIVANETPGVIYTRDNDLQANLNKMVGWQTVQQEISARMEKIGKIAQAAAEKILRRL
jgi:hypothetical protein